MSDYKSDALPVELRRHINARERPSLLPAGLERETGIEPATNSLEGCDSTIELLPPAPADVTILRDALRTGQFAVREPLIMLRTRRTGKVTTRPARNDADCVRFEISVEKRRSRSYRNLICVSRRARRI